MNTKPLENTTMQATACETPEPAGDAPATTDHGPRFDSCGRRTLVAVVEDQGLSNSELGKLLGVAKSTAGSILRGERSASKSVVDLCAEHFGIEAAFWSMPPGDEPDDETEERPQPQPDVPAPPRGPASELGALDEARDTLAAVDAMLAGSLHPSERAKLLAQRLQCVRTIGSLTGELDQTDLQKFHQSPEYKASVARLVGIIHECPTCTARVLEVMTLNRVKVTPKYLPMGFAEIALHCGHVEHHVSIDDLAPACDDGLHYPIQGRERELCDHSLPLARRALAALRVGHPLLCGSKQAQDCANESRAALIEVLASEVSRADRIEAFTKDFGAIAAQEAKEAFA